MNSSANPEILSLTGIRAVAAAWVVVGHFRLLGLELVPSLELVDPWVASGYLGVEVFFVLSGFIIAYNYADRFTSISAGSYRRFMFARLARIYPTHFVTLLAMLALVAAATVLGISLSDAGVYRAGSFVGNLLLLQGLPTFPAWNDPAWTICLEFAAYLTFPLIALMLVRVSTRAAFVVASLVALLGTSVMVAQVVWLGSSPTTFGVAWARIATEFTVGCLLYAGWRGLGDLRSGRHWDLIAVAAAAGTFVLIGFVPQTEGWTLITTPLIAAFVLACAGASGVVGRFLSHRVMLWGGRVSYSVYMTHFILLMVIGEVLAPSLFAGAPTIARAGVLTAYYAIVVVVGWATYRFVEVPGRALIKRIALRDDVGEALPAAKWPK